MVVVALGFSTKTQNKPSKTSEEELIEILKRLAKTRVWGGGGGRELPYEKVRDACHLAKGNKSHLGW